MHGSGTFRASDRSVLQTALSPLPFAPLRAAPASPVD